MDSHQELLRAVFEHFEQTGDWPALVPLQMKFRRLGSLQKLALEIGRDKIRCDRPGNDAKCQLTLRAVDELDDSGVDIQHFLCVVRRLAANYIANGSGSVVLQDLVADLEISDIEVQRLAELIHIAPGLWTSMSGRPSRTMSMTPSHNIWYFDEVYSLNDFYAALERAHEDERLANQISYAGFTAPPPVQATHQAASTTAEAAPSNFVEAARLEQLRSLTQSQFDLQRLIAMCEELNRCAQNDCVFATAMLTRAIIDHVPPVFSAKNFDEVANNYGGSKSFKDSMKGLATSARSIADGHLHVQIRKKEVLPTRRQVNFSHDIDVLLSEIVRILS